MGLLITIAVGVAGLVVGGLMGRAAARVIVQPPLVLDAAPTDAQVEAACREIMSSWTDRSIGSFGVTQARSSWRLDVRNALEAAAATPPVEG